MYGSHEQRLDRIEAIRQQIIKTCKDRKTDRVPKYIIVQMMERSGFIKATIKSYIKTIEAKNFFDTDGPNFIVRKENLQ